MDSPSATTRTRMTRRDFELIARVLRENRPEDPAPGCDADWLAGRTDMHQMIARDLANDLGRVHPKFDHDRFLTACGVTV